MITKISSQVSSDYIYGKKNTPVAEKFSIPSVERSEQVADMSASEKSSDLLSIAKKYDITNISPNELVEMSNKLYDGGHISFEEHAMFIAGPSFLNSSVLGEIFEENGMDASKLPNLDTPMNYLAELTEKLDMGGQPNRACLESDMNNLALAEKLAALHKQATDKDFQSLGEIQTNPAGLMIKALSSI